MAFLSLFVHNDEKTSHDTVDNVQTDKKYIYIWQFFESSIAIIIMW